MNTKLCIIACEYFQQEIEAVLRQESFAEVTTFFYPAECGSPALSEQKLCNYIQHIDEDKDIILLGSCCMAEAKEFCLPSRVSLHLFRVCFNLILNDTLVEYYLQEKAYLLTPGWLMHWKEWIDRWKFDNQTFREFANECIHSFLLLDTGVFPTACEQLKELAVYADKSYTIIPVGLDYVRHYLLNLIMSWKLKTSNKKNAYLLDVAEKNAADYAMAADLLVPLSRSKNEKDAIENTLHLFSVLFAPQSIHFIPFIENTPVSPKNTRSFLHLTDVLFDGNYTWTPSGKGFSLRVNYSRETLGVLIIDHIAFPEYKKRYLNLALSIIDVCALAIVNARHYQQLLGYNTPMENGDAVVSPVSPKSE